MTLSWEELRSELKRQGYIQVLWHRDDISSLLEKRSVQYTDEDLKEIVEYIEHAFDASVGISWEVLEGYIDQWLEENSIG